MTQSQQYEPREIKDVQVVHYPDDGVLSYFNAAQHRQMAEKGMTHVLQVKKPDGRSGLVLARTGDRVTKVGQTEAFTLAAKTPGRPKPSSAAGDDGRGITTSPAKRDHQNNYGWMEDPSP
jgi:hypothetical protein